MDFKNFDQFKPKTVKEILEESRERQTSKMKEIAETYAEYFQEWYQAHMEYLKDNNSASQTLSGDADWNPSGTRYNEDGNRIRFYNVVGGDGNNRIDMDTRTHDNINGGKGCDDIYGGWGDDVITGGTNTRAEWSDIDIMRGEGGNDIITAHAYDYAFGGQGRDELRGYSNSELQGGEGSDIFKVYTRDVGEGNDGPVNIEDFSSEDKIVVDFSGNGSRFSNLGNETAYIGRHDIGTYTFVYDANDQAVAMINEVDLTDYSVEVSDNGMFVTITGSDFI